MTNQETMKLALDVLKNSQDYKMGRSMTVEAVEALEEAVLKLDRQIVSLQCAHCQVTIETLNDKVMSLLAKQEQGEKPFYKVEGPTHVVCRCDKCKIKQEQGEPKKVWQEIDCPNCGDMAKMFTPQQRTWAGLTDEEAQWLYDNCRTPANLIDMTEAKLKDKNNG
jgi:hypothetical protein